MTTQTLDTLVQQVEILTLEEQLLLLTQLAEKVRHRYNATTHRRKWREIRGAARTPLVGEDVQTWVSRTRQEGDTRRESQWRVNS